jgi:hypothetical protein
LGGWIKEKQEDGPKTGKFFEEGYYQGMIALNSFLKFTFYPSDTASAEGFNGQG